MGPTRKSRSVNKRYSYINEVSPIRHGESADRRNQRDIAVANFNGHVRFVTSSMQKRKLSDMLGPLWSKEELERFYEAYRKHGKDWKKVGAVVRNRSIEMVEALYSMNRAYLSLPEGTASVAGLIAMMTDHYCNLAGSDSEQESNDGAGTSRKPQKRAGGKVQPKASKGSDGHLPSHSLAVASSYDCVPLLKKKRSGGSRPRVVGKRTPRFPVSNSYENVNGEKYFSPTRQSLKFKIDANDDEVAHEIAKTLAEASQRGGSPQDSRTPKKMVGGSDMDEDGLEGSMEADNGDFSRDKSYLMKTGSLGTLSQKGRRHYGKKLEVDSNGNNHLDDIREACSGTEGQKLDAVRGKSDFEVTNSEVYRCSQGPRKRSKKVLFRRDEDSGFDALQTLADLSLMMPESTNDNEPSVQIKEESNEVVESESMEAMPAVHQKEKHRLFEVKVKGNHSVSGLEFAIGKTSKPGKVSVHDVSTSPEAKHETHQSITKMSRKKQKTMTSKIPKAEAQSDTHTSAAQEAEARDVGKKSTSKGKRSSQSASPKLVKHPENSSSSTDPRKEGGDSALSTFHVPIGKQVDIITKVRSRRKMKLQKPQSYADLKLSDKTVRGQVKLSNCFSNHRVRRWCAFEWFYSAIDYPWFAKREFVEYLFHVGLGHVPRLTRVEWGVIRSSLGKPRRFSEQFLKEEKEKLNQYRDSVRTHYTELRSGTREGLPTDLARPLSVGQRVIAIHPKTREIHDGSVLTVDHNRCRVQFVRPELGVEFVMDIDCMPLNPLDNMPTSLVRHTVAVDKFLENFNELKMNGHTKDQVEGYIKFSSGENLENMDVDPDMLPATYPTCNLLKQAKLASGIVDSQAKMGPKENPTNQQTSYSQPSSRAQIEAKEADVQALAELTRALEKKKALVSELGQMNKDVLENQKDGECALKDSEPFKKQHAAVVIQLQEANERVSSALYCLRQRNTYQGSLPWPRSVTNSGDSGFVLSSFNCSEIHTEESGSHVNEIVESSRSKARTMVNSAIQAFSSMKGGENTFEKIEEAIDYVNDQLLLDDPYMPTGRSFVAADHGNFALQEQIKSSTLASSLQAVSTSQQLKNPSPVPSELITKCVATLLMIQKCTERQFPPADVAQILDSAVTSLQPCCSQNLPVYADIEKCMIMIRNQIMALIPT